VADVEVRIRARTQEAERALSDFADSASSSLKKIGRFADIGSVYYGVKAAVESAQAALRALEVPLNALFRADDVAAVNQQFQVLTRNAGISAVALKDALVGIADGLIDDSDLMQIANKSIIEMGSNASKLPAIFEASRKITAAGFGTDLKANFEEISSAIARLQTRSLGGLGIIIDQEKAYRDYAASIGKAGQQLSHTGKQQALLAAVLKQTESGLRGVDPSVRATTESFQRLKVQLGELGEAMSIAFSKLTSGIFKASFDALGSAAKSVSTHLVGAFGAGADQAAARVDILKKAVAEGAAELKRLQSLEGKGGYAVGTSRLDLERRIQQVGQEQLQNRITLVKWERELAKLKKESDRAPGSKTGGTTDSLVEPGSDSKIRQLQAELEKVGLSQIQLIEREKLERFKVIDQAALKDLEKTRLKQLAELDAVEKIRDEKEKAAKEIFENRKKEIDELARREKEIEERRVRAATALASAFLGSYGEKSESSIDMNAERREIEEKIRDLQAEALKEKDPEKRRELEANIVDRRRKLEEDLAQKIADDEKKRADDFRKNMERGAQQFVSGTVSGLVSLIPGVGQALGPVAGQLIQVLSQGPEQVREWLNAFLDALPGVIENIVASIPVFLETMEARLPDIVTQMAIALADQAPLIGVRLAAQMPMIGTRMASELALNAPTIVEAFAKEFLKIPGQFLQMLRDELAGIANPIGDALSGGGVLGGGLGGLAGGLVMGPIGAGAGAVAGAIGLDLRTQARGDASSSGPRQLVIKLQLGQRELAESILDLERAGFRLS
jgi:hypothetical protein